VEEIEGGYESDYRVEPKNLSEFIQKVLEED
jgi:hypothetical protein